MDIVLDNIRRKFMFPLSFFYLVENIVILSFFQAGRFVEQSNYCSCEACYSHFVSPLHVVSSSSALNDKQG